MKRSLCPVKVLAVLLSITAVIAFSFDKTSADGENDTVTVEVTYDEDGAIEMFNELNEWRTSEGVWYWASNDTDKIYPEPGELTYDPALEQIARQRGAELIASFAHKRPDGSSFNTVEYNGITSQGENLSAGRNTLSISSQSMTGLKEEDKQFAGQGHRRNMLNEQFTAVGIAHVQYGNYNFWVQEFGTSNSGMEPIGSLPTVAQVEVPISFDECSYSLEIDTITCPITKYSSESYYRLYLDDVFTKPLADICVKTGNAFAPGIPVNKEITFTSSNEDILSFENGIPVLHETDQDTQTVTVTASCTIGEEEFNQSFELSISKRSIGTFQDTWLEDQVYTGNQILPDIPDIVINGHKLVKDTDYRLSGYYYNKDISTDEKCGMIFLYGQGRYRGQLVFRFNIVAKDIADCTIEAVSDQVYTGEPITPSLNIKNGDVSLVLNRDYRVVSITSNTDAGSASMTIEGIGNYKGTKDISFNIVSRDIAGASVSSISDRAYTGRAVTPNFNVVLDGVILQSGTDYTYEMTGNTDVGTATVTITGIGNYKGEITSSFNITSKDISADDIAVGTIDAMPYTSVAIEPDVVISYGEMTLVRGTDYEVSFEDNTDIGQAKITITGIGNFTGSRQVVFEIEKASLVSDKLIMAELGAIGYTGSEITPEVSFSYEGVELVKDTDYTIEYSNNINAGKGKITVTGIGNYSGSKVFEFVISPVEFDWDKFATAYINPKTYNGSVFTPEIDFTYDGQTLTKDVDYEISYSDNVNVGDATASIIGIGNYSGTLDVTFKIRECAVGTLEVRINSNDVYSGGEVTPDFEVVQGDRVLVAGLDYTFELSDNIEVGKGKITVNGIGNYSGSTEVEFDIGRCPLEESEFSYTPVGEFTFTGSEIKPDLSFEYGESRLIKGTDYELTYSNNINAGTAAVIVTGLGNYEGSFSVNFTIRPLSIENAEVSEITEQYYYGEAVEPVPEVTVDGLTLVCGTDFTLSYQKNTSAGMAACFIKGIGNYTGSTFTSFMISIPTATATPVPTATATPVPTATATPVPTATATPVPTATATPVPTATTKPTDKPKPTTTVKPTATPKPTATTKPKATLKPTATATPRPTATKKPTSTPKPTANKKPTATPRPTATKAPTPTQASWIPTSTPVPVDPKKDIMSFVERIYVYVLDREPESGGATYWTNELYRFELTGAQVAEQFIFSEEFIGRNTNDTEFVTILYKTFFGRDADQAGLDYWLGQLSSGTMTRHDVAAGFINSREWANTCASYGIRSGGENAPTETIAATELTYDFVKRMYTTCMKREYDEGGLKYWSDELANFRATGESCGASFFLSEEMTNMNLSDFEFIMRLYRTFMDREADQAGLDYWSTQLKGGMTRQDVVFGFTRSAEFMEKCVEARILPF